MLFEIISYLYWFGIVFMFYLRTTLLTEKVNKFKQNTTTLCTKYHFGNALFYSVALLIFLFLFFTIVIPILKDDSEIEIEISILKL